MTDKKRAARPAKDARPTLTTDTLSQVVAEPPPVETLPDTPIRTIISEDIPDARQVNEIVDRLLSTQPEEQPHMSPTGEFDADVVVIGSGPGGYVSAIRAAQLGARTVCIEKEASEWGGTCLNWGCIPTKTLIASTERLHHVQTAGVMGVTISGEIGFDFAKMMERKTKVVTTLRGGVSALLKSNHVRAVVGTASLVDANTVEGRERRRQGRADHHEEYHPRDRFRADPAAGSRSGERSGGRARRQQQRHLDER